MEYLTENLLWKVPATTDVSSQIESTSISDIWSGVKNFFTPKEMAVEMQELREPIMEAVREAPRLIGGASANIPSDFDADELSFLQNEFNEEPDVYTPAEFMSEEYVGDLESL